MKKYTSVFILFFFIALAAPIHATAINMRIPHNNLSLNFSNGSAVCSVSCIGNTSTDDLDVTLTLYENNSYVYSWCENGTGYVSFSDEYEDAVHGKTYKLTLTWYVNGISQPSVSTEKYYL